MKRLVLLFLPLLTACGYALVGSANNLLAPTVHPIEVPAFVNRTTRVELEQRVTQAGAAEFGSRGRLKRDNSAPTPGVHLRGSIHPCRGFPGGYNTQGRATEYQISI